MNEAVWIGFDPRECSAYAVARRSCRRRATRPTPVRGVVLSELVSTGLSTRKIEMRPSAADKPLMWDVISDAPQSTEHANSRFLVPYLAQSGWALFCDGDVLFLANVCRMFDHLDKRFAIYCVKHSYVGEVGVKMDGQAQTSYSRKNWSSFVVFNCDHPSNRCLTKSTSMANSLPGRDLHRFSWLEDEEIGELDPAWNFLVGVSDSTIQPNVVHFTLGTPDMVGYEDVPYAREWRKERDLWAA